MYGYWCISKLLCVKLDNIFAIGDCASKLDLFTNKSSNVRLASIAAKEGRNAAYNLFKQTSALSVQGIMNLFSTSIDGKYYAAAGMTTQQCEKAGFETMEVELSAANKHPGSLPDSVFTNGLFIFDKKNLALIGVQLSGDKEVAEMINALGIAMQNKATAFDLYSYNYGTHPLGTASPNKYIIHQVALKALSN